MEESILPVKCLEPRISPEQFLNIVNELAGMVWENKNLSMNFPYDLLRDEATIKGLSDHKDILKKYVRKVIKRNVREGEGVTDNISDLLETAFEFSLDIEGEKYPIILHLARSLAEALSARGE